MFYKEGAGNIAFAQVARLVLDQAPCPLGTKVLQWNSHPVPRVARAKEKQLLLSTNWLPRKSNPRLLNL